VNVVIETRTFSQQATRVWQIDDYETFIPHIARFPLAGDVIPGTGGVRKIRWRAQGSGKRGGVRIIYFNRSQIQETWLLTLYAKNERETIPAHELKEIKEAIDGEENE
jgi:hypothetical protein